MYNFSEIQSLHIELTTKCNAACPMCPRTIHGGVLNPNLYTEELGMDFFQEYFPKEWLSSLRDIFFCGNYGDPAAAQDTLEVFSYLRNANPALYLHMHTNGSIRDAKWWGALAKIIGKNGNVSFGVDGLEDTLQLYRVGCSYPKIMENARAFIQAGAEARWNFYVFEHNEHQIEQAAEEAKRIGFRKFVAKKNRAIF